MNELKLHGRETFEEQNKRIKVTSLMQALRKGKSRVLFGQWREGCKQRVKCQSMLSEKAIQSVVKERQKLISLVQKRIEEQLIQSRVHLKLFDTFVAWKSFIQARKTLKVKIHTYRNQELERAKSKHLTRWSKRNEATQMFKRVKSKVDTVYQKSLVKSCFEGIRYYNQINKGLSQRLSSMAIILDRIFVLRAFRKVKTEAESRSYIQVGRKFKGGRILKDLLEKQIS